MTLVCLSLVCLFCSQYMRPSPGMYSLFTFLETLNVNYNWIAHQVDILIGNFTYPLRTKYIYTLMFEPDLIHIMEFQLGLRNDGLSDDMIEIMSFSCELRDFCRLHNEVPKPRPSAKPSRPTFNHIINRTILPFKAGGVQSQKDFRD